MPSYIACSFLMANPKPSLLDRVWYGKHPLSLALVPVSAALGGAAWLRRRAYQRGWLASRQSSVPVVVVGNISVGGTGKTPFIIWLGNLLSQQGIRIGVVSRGYKAQALAEDEALALNADSLPEQVGDEPYMIFQHLGCPMAISAERMQAADLLTQSHELDLILSDDGMQHYAMDRALEIALVDGTRGLGNQRLLPAGPLREPASRLQQVDFVVANTQAFGDAPVMRLQASRVLSVANDQTQCQLIDLQGQTVHAVAGIGNPQRFFDTLRDAGLEVIPHAFPDHHSFTDQDLQFDDDNPVLMTEKDAVKCRKLGGDKLWYVPVEAQLPHAFSDQLLSAIKNLIQRF